MVRAVASRARASPRHLQAGLPGQFLDGLAEVQSLVLHQEADGGAVGAAAEAVVELLVVADGERGGLLVVKGAAGLVVLAGLLQRHAAPIEVDDIGSARAARR